MSLKAVIRVIAWGVVWEAANDPKQINIELQPRSAKRVQSSGNLHLIAGCGPLAGILSSLVLPKCYASLISPNGPKYKPNSVNHY